jgi:hypothetical protein
VRLETRKRQFVEGLGFFAVLVFLVASSSARSESAYAGYPSSIAVLAHSGATGENSDPARPGQEVRANSWATGTNPAVNSVYLRILAENPKIKGHNVNLAHGNATVRDLVVMSKQVVAMTPKPELVLIQIMDADMVCPATKRDYTAFRTTFLRPNGRPSPTLNVGHSGEPGPATISILWERSCRRSSQGLKASSTDMRLS